MKQFPYTNTRYRRNTMYVVGQTLVAPRFVRPSYEDYDNRRYLYGSRHDTGTASCECHRCDRRLWYRDSCSTEMWFNEDTPLDFCKECVSYMLTAYKVGRRLGTVRPWSEPPLIETHIRTFLDPSGDWKLVRRRRFEAAWIAILSRARTKAHGTSSRITIADLDWEEYTGAYPVMGRYELWLGTGDRYINTDDGQAFIVRTLLEHIMKFL